MNERIQRVTEMEARLNRVAAWLANPSEDSIAEDIRILDEYYQGPLWRSDFEADEAGAFPPGLPRGVLSEDAVYHALTEYEELGGSISQTTGEGVEERSGKSYNSPGR